MIFSFSSFLVFEIVSLEIVAIFILKFTLPVLQSLLKHAFEEYLFTFVQLALPPEAVVLPLPNILIYLIEPVSSITTSLSFYEWSFIDVSIVINCLAKPMRLGSLPWSTVLFDVIVLDWLIMINALALGLTLIELSFIDWPVCKFEKPTPLLLIILPLAFINITVGISINTEAMLGLAE